MSKKVIFLLLSAKPYQLLYLVHKSDHYKCAAHMQGGGGMLSNPEP